MRMYAKQHLRQITTKTLGQAASAVPTDHKQAFLAAATDLQTASNHRLEAPVSPYVLQAGSVIPAALVTGIRSDLPG
ncbi:MAG: conjugation TrbI family protein, partial [Caulobacter sp.]|nr:conjugation TrbI family protein [Caulobacter sp.]